MDEPEYNYIKHQILSLTGVDLNCYKAPQMQRRLEVYLKRSGSSNWANLFRVLKTDPAALNNLKDYLTINVSTLFRDAEKYEHLQNSILPQLMRARSSLRVWSAGCSRGQEAYSLAILLNETSNKPYQYRIWATDIDGSALDWARAGGPYSDNEMVNVPLTLRQKYFTLEQGGYRVKETLKQNIVFKQHDLLKDQIIGRFDLIVCRNVVIYFQPDSKDKLYQRFYKALYPAGILFVGGTEIIFKAAEMGFETAGISFYRRKA